MHAYMAQLIVLNNWTQEKKMSVHEKGTPFVACAQESY
jgi:hypothetical protein